jgi:hypothetical protein
MSTKRIGIEAFSSYQRLFGKKTNSLPSMINIVKQGKEIKVGGPSFRLRPFYNVIHSLDNCNFQNNILWNSYLQEEQFFTYYTSKNRGDQVIQDGINLSRIPSESYNFLLPSHVVDIDNPFKSPFRSDKT